MPNESENKSQADAHERKLIRNALQEAQDQGSSGQGGVTPSGMQPTVRPDFLPGYTIEAEIHRGGQGVVYRATQQSTRRVVAIKVMQQHAFGADGDQLRFDREVRILAQLKHPNIVTIHDRSTASGSHCFVMDYIEGLPLNRYVQSRGLSVTDTVRLFIKVCEAVNAAHLHGVIHRDLKPGNVLVDERGEPHVLDFGLAKMASADGQSEHEAEITATGQFVGTLAWASPEQATGVARGVDMRSDIYSLGLMLYQALTGRLPYAITGHVQKTLQAIAHDAPEPPSRFAPQISGDLETIILKCLSKVPERRYDTAGGLAADLTRLLSGEPIDARRDSSLYLVRMFARRHRTAALVGLAFVALLAGATVSLAYMNARQKELLDIAETNAKKAQEAESVALRRAEETRQVAEFQSAQLSGVDTALMGLRIRDDLVDRVRAAARDRPADQGGADEATRGLENLLVGVNFTDLATNALDENVLQRTASAIDQEFAEQPLVRARLLQSLGTTFNELGLVDEAISPLTEAYSIRQRLLGVAQPETLASINSVAKWYLQKGQADKADPYCRDALENSRRVLGRDHPVTMDALTNMSAYLWDVGRLEESTRNLESLLDDRRRVQGDSHPETINLLSLLGRRYEAFGEREKALQYCREALEQSRRTLGNDHQQTLLCISNLGSLLQAMGRPEEAVTLLEEAVETSARVMGLDHPFTVVLTNNVAYMLEHVERYDDALQQYNKALDAYGRSLGSDHPNTLIITRNIGRTLQRLGRNAEAEAQFKIVVSGCRRALGPEHPETLKSMAQLGALLQAMERWEEAETQLLAAAEGAAGLPPGYKLTSAIYRVIVGFYEARDRAQPNQGFAQEAANWQQKRDALKES